MKGAGGGAGGIAGEAFEAPNMKSAGEGAGEIADVSVEAPMLGSISCDTIRFSLLLSSFLGTRFSVGSVGRKAVRAQVGLI